MKHFFYSVLCCLLIFSCKKDTGNNERRAQNTISTATWMQDLIAAYPNKNVALKDIMIPGAHDAGLYELSSCTFGANACNTQTQRLSFEQQLLQGIRIFDVRPTYANRKFFTEHATSCEGLGCKGALLETTYKDVRKFLDTHAELVILEISHYCKTSPSDTALLSLTSRILGDRIYKEETPNTTPFTRRPLQDIIGSNTTGKVVLIYEGIADNAENRAKGMFASTLLLREGRWINSHYLADMLRDQVKEYNNFSNESDKLFQFSWQITQNELQAINCALNPNAPSIQKCADSANAVINTTLSQLITDNEIRKGRIPNIIYLDYSASFVTRECIRISLLNLE
ncbi:MAG TPA: hypothetical protein PLU78_04855 [Chitinophagales bacterium]|nr:hypothetical protein [Chitinophagales bacterium]